ncbi:class I adenylate-forming enzyme family protein [Cryptosporangium minutisporangium]|uniref:Long-chain fatty acid--CoA ligase n=1 Tax=Cryptosporangium minutisporangium TaxID=113569 RepID=A0ABP6T0Y3_9ACTN
MPLSESQPTADETTTALLRQARQTLTAPGTPFEILEEDVRGNRMPVFRHRIPSLSDLFQTSRRHDTRTYVVDGDVRLDFRTHAELVDALAAALQTEFRVRPGDRVALYAANRWEWIVCFWAITVAGAIPSAFNGWWSVDEFTAAARLVEPVLLIGDGPRLERAAESGLALRLLGMDEDLPAVLDRHRRLSPTPAPVSEDDPAMLIFTSGTTGRAKAVAVPHRAVSGHLQLVGLAETAARVAFFGQPVPAADDPVPVSDDVVLLTSPLFHVSMLYGAVFPTLAKGSQMVVVPGRFDPERVLRVIEQERVTMWMALGSAAPRLCASPALGRYDTSSVRVLGVGGAPVSPAVQRGLREAFPSASQALGMGYTSTEAGATVASINGPEYVAHPTSTGRVFPTTTVELRDPLGAPVPEGELGEVHVRSPYVMLGYWNDPDASAAVLKTGGWLAMGDMARLRSGLLYIDSRARDMILVSAENVSPTEVEYRLDEHPDVLEAAVFAVDDDLTGDAVCAVVVTGPTSSVGTAELTAWCRSGLAHYKVPTQWHLTQEPLPRTASGKLVKSILRDQLTNATIDS